jgi:hypothetical protein
VGFVEPARAFAISKASNEWVLVLDADEMVPFPLSQRMRAIVENDEADMVMIPWCNYLLGAPMMFAGWGPEQDPHMRFFKKSMCTSASAIHTMLDPVEGARLLELAYRPGFAVLHFNYMDMAHFIDKLNRYTSIEAEQALSRGRRCNIGISIYVTIREFVRRYIGKKGYRDGWRGLFLSGTMAFYRWARYAKMMEMQETGGRDAIIERYRKLAEQTLGEYH